MTRPKGTRRAASAAVNRAKVLDSAKRLFEHHGYDAVTIRQVAAEAGVSTGSIFSNVADKAALFEAATGHRAPDVAAFLLKVGGAGIPELSREAMILHGHVIGHHG